MAVEIKVPELGESIVEATVSRWMKHEGDAVAAGEPIVELETDKVNLEVGAQQAGVIEKIMAQEGASVRVGEALAVLRPGADGEKPDAEKLVEKAPAATTVPGGTTAPATPAAADTPVAPSTSTAAPTPVALRAARELGVDIAQVKPSGSGGRVTREDVEAYAKAAPASQAAPTKLAEAAAPQPAPAGRETRERMTRRRQTIARRLVEAQRTAAMLTTFNEIDMSALMALRKRRREAFKARYGVDLGLMSFFVKAVVAALREYPYVNAEIAAGPNGDEVVVKHYYDIGVAIGAEEGLVVPVVRAADALSFAGIEKAIRGFVEKVQQGSLTIEDLRGGTFTITNGGVYGSLMSTPILNPPQVGILGMHAIKERAVIVDGQVTARPMMYVALSYDHRLVDGQTAVRFLVRVKELIEDPETLLFG